MNELLAAIIAPASRTFSDVDADFVTITTLRGTVIDRAGAILLCPFAVLGQQLLRLNFNA